MKKLIVIGAVTLGLAAGLALGLWLGLQAPGGPADSGPRFVPLEQVEVAGHPLQFYVDYGHDSAVLGFATTQGAGRRRYFPLYASTYRGLPAVTLEVHAPQARDQLWVLSSWEGHEVLAYHRVGSDRCTTIWGEQASHDRPTPASLGGGSSGFPAMDRARVRRIATITYRE